MTRETQVSGFLICAGLAIIALLFSVSSAAAQSAPTAQADDGTAVQGDQHRNTDTGNCPPRLELRGTWGAAVLSVPGGHHPE